MGKPPEIAMQEIRGRDNGSFPCLRYPIYRARIPPTWQREDPSATASLVDTTKALCTLRINGGNGQEIRITLHSFPITSEATRIPPTAQVMRWQRQFSVLDSSTLTTTVQAFNGFSGFLFSATGEMQGHPTTMLAWTLQLAPQHEIVLAQQNGRNEEEVQRGQQRRADLTIKAVGPPDLMAQHRQAILAFARSVELIEGIPN